jgi:hypothetical protein
MSIQVNPLTNLRCVSCRSIQFRTYREEIAKEHYRTIEDSDLDNVIDKLTPICPKS